MRLCCLFVVYSYGLKPIKTRCHVNTESVTSFRAGLGRKETELSTDKPH